MLGIEEEHSLWSPGLITTRDRSALCVIELAA